MKFIICEDGPYTGIDGRMFSFLGSCDCNQMSVRLKSILIMEKWAGPLNDSRWETRLGNSHQNTQKMDTRLSWMCLGTNTGGGAIL